MPVKRRIVRRTAGKGFFGDLWSGIKSGVSKAVNVAKDAIPIARDVISTIRAVRGGGVSKATAKRVKAAAAKTSKKLKTAATKLNKAAALVKARAAKAVKKAPSRARGLRLAGTR